jgi:hypothetical protein
MKRDLEIDMKLERVLYDELTKLFNMEINERTYLELKLEINKSCPDNYLCADRSKVGDKQKQYVIKNGKKEITLSPYRINLKF